jgi:predicted GH43/DUF377 family glycosyl hydrolase
VIASPSLFRREPSNPILTPEQWPIEVNSVFNPGACQVGGDVLLLCRVEDRRGISHLWCARSANGVDGWRVDPEPFLSPRPGVDSEQWGLEDARVVRIEELDRWVITGTAYGPGGPAVFMVVTDFTSIEHHGMVMPPEDKNAALFPRRINGQWVLIHRPVTTHGTSTADVWLSRSLDLDAWRSPELVLRARSGAWWDSVRVGLGPPPLETPHGWLLIYHGVRTTTSGAIYRVGAALLDLEDPTIVRHRSPEALIGPRETYERVGDVTNVVFPCGAIHDERNDTLRIYYGAADTTVACATTQMSALVDYLRSCPPG